MFPIDKPAESSFPSDSSFRYKLIYHVIAYNVIEAEVRLSRELKNVGITENGEKGMVEFCQNLQIGYRVKFTLDQVD